MKWILGSVLDFVANLWLELHFCVRSKNTAKNVAETSAKKHESHKNLWREHISVSRKMRDNMEKGKKEV